MVKAIVYILGLLFIIMGVSANSAEGADMAFWGLIMCVSVCFMLYLKGKKRQSKQDRYRAQTVAQSEKINPLTGFPMSGFTYTFNGRTFTDYHDYSTYRAGMMQAYEESRRRH